MNSRKAFIFFGPPGAGKGTVSRKCVEELGWEQLSTGDLFRKHIQEQTALGQAIEKAISEGRLVDDEIVIDIVCQWVMHRNDSSNPLIFDGFPRTIKQAELFLNKMKTEMDFVVIVLEIDDKVVINRLVQRKTCQNFDCQRMYTGSDITTCQVCGSPLYQRADDMLDTIKNRLLVYHHHANQLLNFYKAQGIFIQTINADQPVEDVFHDVLLAAGESQ